MPAGTNNGSKVSDFPKLQDFFGTELQEDAKKILARFKIDAQKWQSISGKLEIFNNKGLYFLYRRRKEGDTDNTAYGDNLVLLELLARANNVDLMFDAIEQNAGLKQEGKDPRLSLFGLVCRRGVSVYSLIDTIASNHRPQNVFDLLEVVEPLITEHNSKNCEILLKRLRNEEGRSIVQLVRSVLPPRLVSVSAESAGCPATPSAPQSPELSKVSKQWLGAIVLWAANNRKLREALGDGNKRAAIVDAIKGVGNIGYSNKAIRILARVIAEVDSTQICYVLAAIDKVLMANRRKGFWVRLFQLERSLVKEAISEVKAKGKGAAEADTEANGSVGEVGAAVVAGVNRSSVEEVVREQLTNAELEIRSRLCCLINNRSESSVPHQDLITGCFTEYVGNLSSERMIVLEKAIIRLNNSNKSILINAIERVVDIFKDASEEVKVACIKTMLLVLEKEREIDFNDMVKRFEDVYLVDGIEGCDRVLIIERIGRNFMDFKKAMGIIESMQTSIRSSFCNVGYAAFQSRIIKALLAESDMPEIPGVLAAIVQGFVDTYNNSKVSIDYILEKFEQVVNDYGIAKAAFLFDGKHDFESRCFEEFHDDLLLHRAALTPKKVKNRTKIMSYADMFSKFVPLTLKSGISISRFDSRSGSSVGLGGGSGAGLDVSELPTPPCSSPPLLFPPRVSIETIGLKSYG